MSEINLNGFFDEMRRERERKFVKQIGMTWCEQCGNKHDKPVVNCAACGAKLD